MRPVQVTVLTSSSELHALRPEWDALQEQVGQTTIYQSWAWVATWYDHFGRDKLLRIVAVRDADGRLVGIAPLSRSTIRATGARLLHLLGRNSHLTEYVDAVLHPDHERAAARAIFQAWDQRRTEWDLLSLPSIPAESALARTFDQCAADAGYAVLAQEHPRTVIALPESRQAFYSALGPRMKGNVNNLRNRLQRTGLAPEVVVVEDPDGVVRGLDVLFHLHLQRARTDLAPRHPDVFATPERRDFLRAAARAFAERGQAWLFFLRCDREPVAAQLCFRQKDRLFRDSSGYDPQFARYGVMTLLFARCVERAIEHGLREFDLGLGQDQEKLRWGGRPRPVLNLTFASPRLRSRATFLVSRFYKACRASMASRPAPPRPSAPALEPGSGAGDGRPKQPVASAEA